MPVPLLRSDIKKTPGRLVYDPAGLNVSLYSKLNSPIERTLVHELLTVGTDAAGELDYRDREFYGRVRITPDGRLTTNIGNVLWPYGNYRAGQKIFTGADEGGGDKTLQIHGSDASLETFWSAALDVMPPLRFAATETAIGQAEFLCLRTEGAYWSADGTASGLVKQADAGGTMDDSTFVPGVTGAFNAGANPQGILTGPYVGLWNPGVPITLSPFDTLEGFTVEFTVQWSDDSRQAVGLYNRRIKSVGARIRCTPLGQKRESILAAQQGQGAGAIRGRSIQAGNSSDFQICQMDPSGNTGPVMFTLKGAALTEDKQNWSADLVRETDLVWQATRGYNGGALGPLFTLFS